MIRLGALGQPMIAIAVGLFVVAGIFVATLGLGLRIGWLRDVFLI